MKIATLRAWFTLSKPLTHVLGILPFSLGGVLAWNLTGSFDWAVFGLGIFGALLLMLVACYSGEYFDFETDTLAIPFRNRFSGGSQVLQKTDTIEPIHSLIAAFVCLILAGIIGVLLQFHFKTGPLTIPLGILAMIAAFFYSAKPIQWAYIGLGEIWIWLAYGWLSVATPFYLLTGGFVPVVHWASLPIAFTIFNVILINEFPDYPADKQVGKKNLVVRFGKKKCSRLYALVSAAVWGALALSVWMGVPQKVFIFTVPVFALSVMATNRILRKDYRDEKKLERLCFGTILCNWGVTIGLIMAFVL